MSRLSLSLESQMSPQTLAKYRSVTEVDSGLTATFRALFANPQVASGLADLDDLVSHGNLEPWITYTVALTVAHERDSGTLWNSFEPLAREAGVSNAVIDGIAAGTAPRGLLPKEGIWRVSEVGAGDGMLLGVPSGRQQLEVDVEMPLEIWTEMRCGCCRRLDELLPGPSGAIRGRVR